MKKIKTKQLSLAEGIRNQALWMHKKQIAEQDEKILMLLKIEKVASAWTLASLSGIFITSTRRSITNLKHSGQIKEAGSEISKVSGVKNTLYALKYTSEEEIQEWKDQQKMKDEKDKIEQAELDKIILETKKKIIDYPNRMLVSENYLTK